MSILRKDDMTGGIVLLISAMILAVSSFPNPTIQPTHSMTFKAYNDAAEGKQHFSEIQPEENNSSSLGQIFSDSEEKISRAWLIPEIFGKILSPISLFTSSQTEEIGNSQVAPSSTSPSSTQLSPPGFLSRLFPNVIIGRPSIFRVQLYNSDFEDSLSPDGDNSTGPNAVFGSPLCVGLCVPVQVFSENTSLHFLSDKQISLFPPVPNPTPLLTAAKDNYTKINRLDQQQVLNVSANSLSEAKENGGTFSWLSSWIPAAPSLSRIQSVLQLPKLSSSVSDLIG